MRAFGAKPPPGKAWTLGKTAASIKFVGEAELAMQKLQARIEAIKAGEVVLNDWLSVQDFLNEQP